MEAFCPICDNNMEITNKVFVNDNDTSTVTTTDRDDKSSISSHKFEDLDSEVANLDENDIKDILDNNMHNIKLTSKNFNIDDIYKNSHFNKLSGNQKTLVINRIDDKIRKIKVKSTSKSNNRTNNETVYKKKSYFFCNTCGYSLPIPAKTLVFSRGQSNTNTIANLTNLNNMAIYPNTKDYNCVNVNCTTHSNPNIKDATFRRAINGEYIVEYECNICKSIWSTSI